jgi:uncharacterized protein
MSSNGKIAPIVDIGPHLAETPTDLARFCDLPWRHAVANGTTTPPPWNVDGALYPRITKPSKPMSARTPTELTEYLGALGIDLAVVLPGPLLKLALIHSSEYAAALARAYNQWLTETWLRGGDGIYGAIIAAPHAPEDAAREIERYGGDARVVAAVIPIAGLSTLLGGRRFDPLYAAAETRDIPVILHGVEHLMTPSTANQVTQFASDFDQRTMEHSLIYMAHLTHLVGTGVLARFPRLRIVFLGGGLSWLAHLMLRLDKEYSENRRDVPFYNDRVSLTIRQQVWVGTHPLERMDDPRDLDDLIRISCGIDRVLYGSQWPDPQFDSPDRVAAALTGDGGRKILSANALKLFGIDAPQVPGSR